MNFFIRGRINPESGSEQYNHSRLFVQPVK